MNKAAKLFLGISLLLFACEEADVISTQNEFPVDVRTKTFSAKSIKQVYRSPFLGSTSTNSILGAKILRDADGNDLYRVRVRPFYTFQIDSGKRYRITDADGNLTDQLKFVGTHKFIFRVDSLKEDDNFNTGFSQNVDLKLLAKDFSGESVFTEKEGVWVASKNAPLTDPSGERIHTIGTTTSAVESGTAGVKSTHEIEIQNDDIKKLFTRYEFVNSSGDTLTTFSFAGFALDYTVEQVGMISMDTLPSIILNYQEPDSTTISSDTIKASLSQWYVSYEDLNPALTANYGIIKAGSRDGLIVEFDKNEVIPFLRENRYFGAAFFFNHFDETTLNPSLSIFNMSTNERIDDGRYNDNLPYDSLILTPGAVVLNKNDDKSLYESDIEKNDMTQLYDSFFRNWINDVGETAQVLLLRPSTVSPSLATFKQTNQADSLYTLRIYYSEREN